MDPASEIKAAACCGNPERALFALKDCLHRDDISEKSELFWQLLPDVKLDVARRTCLVYLGYLGSEAAAAYLRELRVASLDISSMGVFVALANLGDRRSLQTLGAALRQDDPLLHRQLLACAGNCTQFQQSTTARELLMEVEKHLADSSGDPAGEK